MNRRTFIRGTSFVGLASISPAVAALLTRPIDNQIATEKERLKTVEELVDKKTRTAIQQGLHFLSKCQVTDGKTQGSFGNGGYAGGVAVAALSGLAFLCGGSTPISGPYAHNVRECTDFILRNARQSGYIAENDATQQFSNMYGHGYAMLYLSQVFGMSRRVSVEQALLRAVDLTCKVQNRLGGWRYQPIKQDADLSITICQIMALRAAHSAGFQVSDEVRAKTVQYVQRCQNPDGSFHYTENGGRTSLALTAAGVVSYYSAGIYDGPQVEKALQWIYKNRPGHGPAKLISPMNYYYAHYYAIQAMWHAQIQHPEFWNQWYPLIRDELIDSRRRANGTWPDQRVGPEFATAMSCIILQIPFNYVPVFSP